jgi:hypothetical protein
MKKLFLLLAFLPLLLFTQCGPTTEDAIAYNDKIIAEEFAVIGTIDELSNALGTYDPAKIELALNAAKAQVDKSIEAVKKIGDFDGNSEFLDATLNLFNVFKSQLNNEYKEQFEIYKLPIEQYTTKEENRYNELNKIIDTQYFPAFDKFSKTQDEFATKWKFELEKKY